jgi:hypothetical protein
MMWLKAMTKVPWHSHEESVQGTLVGCSHNLTLSSKENISSSILVGEKRSPEVGLGQVRGDELFNKFSQQTGRDLQQPRIERGGVSGIGIWGPRL